MEYLTDIFAYAGRLVAEEAGARFVEHDVSKPDQWWAMIEQVMNEQGRVDVLVGMLAVAPSMIERDSGSIISDSSLSGLRGAGPCFAYGASKRAIRGMARKGGGHA